MPTIAVTGGIAAGKSSFTRQLQALLAAAAFDADAASRTLLADDPAVAGEIRAAFGEAVFDASGRPMRAALREIVFGADAEPRQRLEAILHPRVRAAWQGWLEEQLQKAPDAVFLVEIPLLYETGAAEFFDHIIVVGCSLATQLSRLISQRHLPETIARRIIASQWELSEKIRLCDQLIWNDGAQHALQAQARICAISLQQPR